MLRLSRSKIPLEQRQTETEIRQRRRYQHNRGKCGRIVSTVWEILSIGLRFYSDYYGSYFKHPQDLSVCQLTYNHPPHLPPPPPPPPPLDLLLPIFLLQYPGAIPRVCMYQAPPHLGVPREVQEIDIVVFNGR